MLASLSRVLGLALAFTLVSAGTARAEEEEEEGGDDGGGDDGGGEEPGEGEGEDEEDPKTQPALTSGGLFTIKTYPVRELFRPLTMTEKITQIRLDLGTDVSDKTAFEFFGVSLNARHGYKDNFTLLGGFNSDYNFKGFAITAGFEGALAYDLFDIRLAANLNRIAAPVSCAEEPSGKCGGDPANNNLPINFKSGAGVQFSVDLGFPFRKAATPEIAVVALETLVQIDFNAVRRGNGGDEASCQSAVFPTGADFMNCTEDGIKPDLAPSLGITTNPIAALNLTLFAQLQIRDFDTTNQFTIPATARVTFSPNQKLDIGLEFKILDLKPKDPDGPDGMLEAPSPIAQRFINFFIQARYGK
jgi:hypothetical protein